MAFSKRVDSYLLHAIKFIIYLIPFISLYIAFSVMYPYVTGKNFAFRILVEFACALWLGLIVLNAQYRPRNSVILSSVLLFILIVGVADIFGVSPYKSFWSNFERMEGYITILHLALYFMIVQSIFKTRRDWIYFFSIMLMVSMLVSFYTYIEPFLFEQTERYIQEFGIRRAGTIGNPAFLATYLLLSVFVGLILIQMIHNKYFRLFCLFAIFNDFIALYITASRGAILAAIIGMAMLVFAKLRRFSSLSTKKIIPSVLGLFILLSTVFIVVHNSGFIQSDTTISRIRKTSLDDPAIRTRLKAWDMAWYGIRENPVLGWGQENFISIYNVQPTPFLGDYIWTDRAHNIIIDWLVSAGVLGLISYCLIYGAVFYTLRNIAHYQEMPLDQVLVMTAAIIAYFIQNLFTFDTINSYLIFFSLIAYIDNVATMDASFHRSEETCRVNRFGPVSVVVSLLAFMVIGYYINYIPIKQLNLFSRINRNLSEYKSYTTMLDDFNNALSYRAFGDDSIRDVMTSVSHQIIDYQLYAKEGALDLVQRSAEERLKGLAYNRHNLEYLMKTIHLYMLIAAYEPSFITANEKLIKEVKRLSPRFRGIEMIEVDLSILKKDYQSAFNSMIRIVESNPEDASKQFKLALVAILNSENEAAKDALEHFKNIKRARKKYRSMPNTPLFSLQQLSQLTETCFHTENYKLALEYYNEMLKILPYEQGIQALSEENRMRVKAKIYYDIARSYYALGDREQAIKKVNEAARLDPEHFADIAKTFID